MISKKLLGIFIWCLFFYFNTSAQDSLVFSHNNSDSISEEFILFSSNEMKSLDSIYLQFINNNCTVYHSDTTVFNDVISEVPDSILRAQVEFLNLNSSINYQFNKYTSPFIKLYAYRRRELMSAILEKEKYYFPVFEKYLRKYDLPLELKYLAVVESALNPKIKSRVGAAGLWQFMYATGKMYDLNVTSYQDDRFDVELATDAACKYLKFLYGMYNNWELALAAYNTGPGNVNKAIRRSGGQRSFYGIYPFLPRETRAYYPLFVGASVVLSNSDFYKLQADSSLNYVHYEAVDSVHLHQTFSMNHLADFFQVNIDVIKQYNPIYYRSIIPGSVKQPGVLKLPLELLNKYYEDEDSLYRFISSDIKKINEIEKEIKYIESLNTKITHKVRSGEVLGTIARKYGVSVTKIKSWNGLRSDRISVGQKLIIYPKSYNSSSATNNSKSSPPKDVKPNSSNGEYFKYTVKSGDSFWVIAKKYNNVSVDDLKKWNPNLNSSNLKVGQIIKIYKK